jgi:molybdopterin-synthase adenylyltransferase
MTVSKRASSMLSGGDSSVERSGVETGGAGPGQMIGARERERLRRSRVLVVGVGGLGAPAALELAAAGVGTLGLVDFDVVEVSNLPRQLAYRTSDIGRPKVIVAAERLKRSYPGISVRSFPQRLSATNASEIFSQFDFVIDGTDHVASKYLVNDAAVLCDVPFSHAGIVGFQGQTMTVLPRRSACFRCLFPTPPLDGEIPTCQEAGIIGPLAGTFGLLQAMEALKYVLGAGRLLADRLLIYDALGAGWRTVRLSANRRCPLCGEQPTIRQVESVEYAAEVCR